MGPKQIALYVVGLVIVSAAVHLGVRPSLRPIQASLETPMYETCLSDHALVARRDYVQGHVIVNFTEDSSRADREQLIEELGWNRHVQTGAYEYFWGPNAVYLNHIRWGQEKEVLCSIEALEHPLIEFTRLEMLLRAL